MAQVVHKIVLQTELHTYQLPEGAVLLHAGIQFDSAGPGFFLWYRCDPEYSVVEDRKIVLVGTGQEFHADKDACRHINSIMANDGRLTFHVFELDDGRPRMQSRRK